MIKGTRRGALAVMAGTIVILAITAPAAPAAPAGDTVGPDGRFGLRLLEVTASLRNDPRARQYIIDHLNPGAMMRRQVEVSNSGDEPLRIDLYPGAASVRDSAFRFASARTPNELTTWTSVDRPVVDVPAHSSQTVDVTIAVPGDGSPGEHYGVLWAQAGSPALSGTGVRMVSRIGIRMYVDVGPGGPPAANFTISALTAKRRLDGGLALDTEIRNSGGRALDVSGTLALAKGPGGLRAGPFHTDRVETVAPGETSPISFTLDGGIPAGPWTATVDLKSGLVERTASAVIRFPDRPGSSAQVLVKRPSTRRVAIMSAGVTGGSLLVVGLLVALARRWRRRASRSRPS
jgi:hypothetical protein